MNCYTVKRYTDPPFSTIIIHRYTARRLPHPTSLRPQSRNKLICNYTIMHRASRNSCVFNFPWAHRLLEITVYHCKGNDNLHDVRIDNEKLFLKLFSVGAVRILTKISPLCECQEGICIMIHVLCRVVLVYIHHSPMVVANNAYQCLTSNK